MQIVLQLHSNNYAEPWRLHPYCKNNGQKRLEAIIAVFVCVLTEYESSRCFLNIEKI